MPTRTRRHLLAALTAVPICRCLFAVPLSSVRLGVTTDEIDEDLVTAMRFLRSFGLEYAEVRSIWGKYNTEQPVEKIREACKICDEYRIRTSVLGTPFFKVPLPPETPQGNLALDNEWKVLDAGMERAKILGTDKLRTFAFTRRPDEIGDEKIYTRIYELVRESARRAKAKGIRLAVENVGGSFVSTGAEAARLLAAVKEDNLGLTWDPNNAGASGEKSFPDGYRLLDPARIIHVHLRDYKRKPDGKGAEWTAVGDGEFDNLGQIRALLKAGYKETFTLETHYRSPEGKAHATRTSLTELLKVIEKV
jgi:sugar phosphate isomerase/epimerase